jgi:hypothetical protein
VLHFVNIKMLVAEWFFGLRAVGGMTCVAFGVDADGAEVIKWVLF